MLNIKHGQKNGERRKKGLKNSAKAYCTSKNSNLKKTCKPLFMKEAATPKIYCIIMFMSIAEQVTVLKAVYSFTEVISDKFLKF